MLLIKNIGSDPLQQHTISYKDYQIVLNLNYLAMVQLWILNISFNNNEYNGIKLSLNTLHLIQFNLPFDFWVVDNSQLLIDPFKLDDFSIARLTLNLVTEEELLSIRGFNVAT